MSDTPPAWRAELAPFLEAWALPTTAGRAARRGDSTAEERQAFYDAVSPHAAEVLDWLDTREWGAYSQDETQLMNLMCAFAHVSIAVEIQRDDEEAHARARRHMAITRSPADED